MSCAVNNGMSVLVYEASRLGQVLDMKTFSEAFYSGNKQVVQVLLETHEVPIGEDRRTLDLLAKQFGLEEICRWYWD